MMDKTIDQMIEELDEKFEGVMKNKEIILKNHRCNFRSGNIFIRKGYLRCGDTLYIEFTNSKQSESIRFSGEIIEKIIKKAHDYFITKGGEL